MRREDLLTKDEKEYLKMNESRGYKYWIYFWKYLYQTVSITTYFAMLVGVVMSFYYSIIVVDLLKAVPAYLIVLLLIYVNKINPK